jgi:hypothetical protein
MRHPRPDAGASFCLLLMLCAAALPAAQAPATTPGAPQASSCAEMEVFLRTAKEVRRRELPVGVTVPVRLTLDNGSVRHDAAVQTVDVKKTTFETTMGVELNFRDAWQFNVAGYELAKLLNLNMVPPYIERTISGKPASVSWWVDDAMMERERFQKKIRPPDTDDWNRQMHAVRVFNELIANTDANMTNMLITKDWRVWMIDFSRAFRMTRTLHRPKSLTRVDRTLLAGLRGLTEERLQQSLGRWLNKPEIQGMLARRDLIVGIFDAETAAKGEAAVLYDLGRVGEPCGSGL